MHKGIENRNAILKAIVSCTNLVVFGVILYSTVGVYFLPAWRDITTLLPAIKFITVGLILPPGVPPHSGLGATGGIPPPGEAKVLKERFDLNCSVHANKRDTGFIF